MAIEPSRHVALHHVVPFLFVGDFWIHYVDVAFKLVLVLKKEAGRVVADGAIPLILRQWLLIFCTWQVVGHLFFKNGWWWVAGVRKRSFTLVPWFFLLLGLFLGFFLGFFLGLFFFFCFFRFTVGELGQN
jgi:hypothetical protein